MRYFFSYQRIIRFRLYLSNYRLKIKKGCKNNESPIKTLLGGEPCVLIAVRTKCNTIMIRVNEVTITRIDGVTKLLL